MDIAASDKDSSVRVAAIEALGALNAQNSVAFLSNIVRANNGAEGGAAPISLGKIGDADTHAVLIEALQRPLFGRPSAAAEGLLRLGHPDGLAAVAGRMDGEVGQAVNTGGWMGAHVSKKALDLYQYGNNAMQTNVERSILGMKQEQPQTIMRQARKLIDAGGSQSFNASALVTPAIFLVLGLLVWHVFIYSAVGLLIYSLWDESIFARLRGSANLEPAAKQVLDE